MDVHEKLCRRWGVLYKLLHRFIEHLFNMTHENCDVEGPCIIIPNHYCGWDPLLVAMSFPKRQMYFVASEHIFRLGLISRLLSWLVAPIPRKKASMGTDTVMSCLRHIRAGHSICLFASGEGSWDGKTVEIFPATGKLVRTSGATLITYKLDGMYFSHPRWGKGIRRGRVHGHPVGIYPPEKLKAMTPAEITTLINSDIAEDAFERQKTERVRYGGKEPAKFISTALFMCPKCEKVTTINGHGRTVSCNCGFSVRYNELCSFDPPVPFENLQQWDQWQHERLKNGDYPHGDCLFSDRPVTLRELRGEQRGRAVRRCELSAYKDKLVCGEQSFPFAEIGSMALVQNNILLFSCGESYYELRSNKKYSLRKYLAVWKETPELK